MGQRLSDFWGVILKYTTPWKGGESVILSSTSHETQKCEAGCRAAGDIATYNYAFFHCGGKYPVGQCVPHAKFTDRDQLEFDLSFEFKPIGNVILSDFGLPTTHTEKGFNWNPLTAFDADAIFTHGAIHDSGKTECGHNDTGLNIKACIRCKPAVTPGDPPQFWMHQNLATAYATSPYTSDEKLIGTFYTPSGVCCPIPPNMRDESNKFRNLFFEHDLELMEPIACEPFTVKLKGYLFVSKASYFGNQNIIYDWFNDRVSEVIITISNPKKIADFTGFKGLTGYYNNYIPSNYVAHQYLYEAQPGSHPWLPTGRFSGGLFNPLDTPPNKDGESMVGVCPDLLNNTQPMDFCVKLEWAEKTIPGYIKPEMEGTLQFTARHFETMQINDVETGAKKECLKINSPFVDPYYRSNMTPSDCEPKEESFNGSLQYSTYLYFNQDINARHNRLISGTMWNAKEWGWDVGYYWGDRSVDWFALEDQKFGNVTVNCNPFSLEIDRIPVYYTRYRQTPFIVGYFKVTITLRTGWIPSGQCTPMRYGSNYYDFIWPGYKENRCRQFNSTPYSYGAPVNGPYANLKDCFSGTLIQPAPQWYVVSGQCVESITIPAGASDGPFSSLEECSGCRQPPQKAKKWYCLNGTCAQYDTKPSGASGPYDTNAICSNACSTPVVKKWYCVSGVCGEYQTAPPGATAGPFDTSAQCGTSCQPIPPPVKFWCVNNTCVNSQTQPVGATAGPFNTLEECGLSCSVPLKWWCLDGNCAESRVQPAGSTGPYSSQNECSASCVPPVRYVYACISAGNCSQMTYETAVNAGLFFYGTAADCASHCTTPPNPYVGYYCVPVTNQTYATTPNNTCIQWGNNTSAPVGASSGPYSTLADCEAGCNQTPGLPFWCVVASDGSRRCVQAATQPASTIGGPYQTSGECEGNCGPGVQPPQPPVVDPIASLAHSRSIVSRVKLPCVNLGGNIEDPATCGCGVSVLRKCSIHGQCRVIGYPKNGEPICTSCPDYLASPTVPATL